MKQGLSKLGQAVEHAGYVRAIQELAAVATLLPAGRGHLALVVPETFLEQWFAIASDDEEPEEPEGDALDQDEDASPVRAWLALVIGAASLLHPSSVLA